VVKSRNDENVHHLRLRKGGAMNQQISDQEWQQLQDHIEGFFSQTLANDMQRIEYKPLFVGLLEMPSESHQSEL
jgi:DNA gyrase inhibitor GyrI